MPEIKNSFDMKIVAQEIINIMAKHDIQIDALDAIFKRVHDEIMKQKINHVEISVNEESLETP